MAPPVPPTLPRRWTTVALASITALAAWMLTAERTAARAAIAERLQTRAREASAAVQSAVASVAGAVARGEGALLGADGRFVEPPEPRTMPALDLPAGRDDEGSWLLQLAGDEEVRAGSPAEALRLYEAASGAERAPRCRAIARARLAAFHRRRGEEERASATSDAFLAELEAEELRTREGLLARALAPRPDAALRDDLLACIGGPDEPVALGLLGTAGLDDEAAVRARRARAARQAELRALAPTADDPPQGARLADGALVAWSRDARGDVRLAVAPLPDPVPGVTLLAPGEPLADPGATWVRYAPVGPLLPGHSVAAAVDPADVRREVRAHLAWRAAAFALLCGAGLAAWSATRRAARRERETVAQQAAFVTRVGHDLRTPLAVIRMYAETLSQQRARTPEEACSFAETIADEARRLGGLVDSVLDLARLEQSGARRRTVDLARLVREVGEARRPLFAQAGVELTVATPDARCECAGDEDALRGALGNLLENALHHGAGPIRLELVVAGGAARLSVSDRGPGVPAELRERVFERFVRGPGATARGAGLGLALVREVAEAHGGDAHVTAREGGGSRFELRVPVVEGSDT